RVEGRLEGGLFMAPTCFRFHLQWMAIVSLTLGLEAPTAAAQCDSTSFDGSRSYAALGGSQAGAAAVASGDFDGDGNPDLAVATPETDGVSVFLNGRAGAFGR